MSGANQKAERVIFLGAPYDLASKNEVISSLQKRTSADHFRYVVTPNVDHLNRLRRHPNLMALYSGAWQSWCDSHIVRRLGFMFGLRLPHLNGTDVVERIFAEVLQPGDRIAVIAARPEIVSALRQRFPSLVISGHSPPMGFIDDPAAVAQCVSFVIESHARLIFIGVGSPQSEKLASVIGEHSNATGTGLCIGAALEFISGMKVRAPKAMQNLGFEWLHRLLSEPGRLWRRYVLGIVPLFGLVAREIMLRFGRAS